MLASALQVPIGCLILVRPGDNVPLDGCVVAGHSALDCSMLTGETRPVEVGPGAEVMTGTINVGLAALQVGRAATHGIMGMVVALLNRQLSHGRLMPGVRA